MGQAILPAAAFRRGADEDRWEDPFTGEAAAARKRLNLPLTVYEMRLGRAEEPDAERHCKMGDRELLLKSGLFDPGFYKDRYSDVAAAGVDPAKHYLKWGFREGRRPHPFFDGGWYLRQNPDVAEAGLNPLVHYLRRGRAEGRPGQKRAVVYTVVTGNYDHLRVPTVVDPELDYVVFGDESLARAPKPWVRLRIGREFENHALTTRYYKALPQLCLPGYEVSAWVDAAYQLRHLSADFLETAGRSAPIAFFAHPERDCAYEEAEVVRALQLDSPARIDRVVKELRKHRFPRHHGLVAGGFIIRRHHDPRVTRAMQDWWRMIAHGSHRDQLSINFVLWKNGLEPRILRGHVRRNRWMYWMGHSPRTLAEARVRFTEMEQELVMLLSAIEHRQEPHTAKD